MLESVQDPSSLPPEVFRRVLSHLPVTSLKAAVLVSQTWSRAGQDQLLWRALHLLVREEQVYRVHQVLALPRLARLVSCTVSGPHPRPDVWEHAIRTREVEVLGQSNIKELSLCNLWVSLLPGGCQQFAVLGCHLTCLTLSCTLVDKEAVTSLLVHLGDQEHQVLRRLTVDSLVSSTYGYGRFVDMSDVPGVALARVASRLEQLHLCRTELSTEQVVEVVQALSTSGAPLQELELSAMDLSGVPGGLLAQAVCRLARVVLHHARLTGPQLSSLLSSAGRGGRTRWLDVQYNSVEGVEGQVLQEAEGKLHKLFYTQDYDPGDEATYYDNFNGEDEDFSDYDQEDGQWSS